MTLAANQPYFLPYLPYWQLIRCADLFLLADDYAYIRSGWVNRNRILVSGKPQYLRLEVCSNPESRLIRDRLLMAHPDKLRKKLRTLQMAYHKAPCFEEGYALAERILRYPERNLALFLEHSIREVCAYLDIRTPIGRTSDLPGNDRFKREERVYDQCRRVGADTYVNAIGGQDLYHFDEFAARGIRLRFIKSGLPPYPQGKGPFVERLSILDAIMYTPREQLTGMLDDYTFIDG